jgi:serine phosphatase RsbU (regulator of sigma subunit)
VLTTDGVVDARLPDGSELGTEGIVEVVRRFGRDAPPDDVAEALVSALRERCRLPLVDDATVVVVRVGPV